jgi:hypothetical protein
VVSGSWIPPETPAAATLLWARWQGSGPSVPMPE